MKAEHRKELETNTLADYLGNALQQAKEGPSQRVLLYGGLILLVVALVITFIWFHGRSKDNDALRWEQWNQLTQASAFDVKKDELKKLKDDYPGKPDAWVERLYEYTKFETDNPGTAQARLARFQQARLMLENDETSIAPPPAATITKSLQKGRELYEKLIDESGDAPLLAQEAILNAAKANETLADFPKAKQLYEKLKKDYPKGLYLAETEKALTRLSNETDLEQLKKLAEKN